jgi:hypothetical protein
VGDAKIRALYPLSRATLRCFESQFQCYPRGVTQRSKRLVRELTVVGVTK